MVPLDADPQTSLSLIFEQAFSDSKIKTTPLFKKQLYISKSTLCLDAKKSFTMFRMIIPRPPNREQPKFKTKKTEPKNNSEI